MNALEWFVGWKLKAMLAIAVLAILGGFVAWGHHDGVAAERKRMAPVVASYELRIERLLGQLHDLEDKLKTSNREVDRLKREGDDREKAAQVALKAAKSQADRYRLRASQIAAAKPTGDQCVASRDLIVSTLKEERQ